MLIANHTPRPRAIFSVITASLQSMQRLQLGLQSTTTNNVGQKNTIHQQLLCNLVGFGPDYYWLMNLLDFPETPWLKKLLLLILHIILLSNLQHQQRNICSQLASGIKESNTEDIHTKLT